MLGSSFRTVRRLCSAFSSSVLLEDCSLQRHLNNSIGKASYGASSIIDTNTYTNGASSSNEIGLYSSTLATSAHVLRSSRAAARRVRTRQQQKKMTTDADAYSAIELALDSVVKIFTVSSSPNYFLPWQNKSQRESMGSGTPLFFYLDTRVFNTIVIFFFLIRIYSPCCFQICHQKFFCLVCFDVILVVSNQYL
jgi:hypothetical protein